MNSSLGANIRDEEFWAALDLAANARRSTKVAPPEAADAQSSHGPLEVREEGGHDSDSKASNYRRDAKRKKEVYNGPPEVMVPGKLVPLTYTAILTPLSRSECREQHLARRLQGFQCFLGQGNQECSPRHDTSPRRRPSVSYSKL